MLRKILTPEEMQTLRNGKKVNFFISGHEVELCETLYKVSGAAIKQFWFGFDPAAEHYWYEGNDIEDDKGQFLLQDSEYIIYSVDGFGSFIPNAGCPLPRLTFEEAFIEWKSGNKPSCSHSQRSH